MVYTGSGSQSQAERVCRREALIVLRRLLRHCLAQYAGSGDVPCARGGMAVCLNNKRRLVVFGGRSGRNNPLLNDVYLLNPDSMKWVQLKVVGSDIPDPVEKVRELLSEHHTVT
eukprot:249637-Prorocentrum_minimum.AAC.1